MTVRNAPSSATAAADAARAKAAAEARAREAARKAAEAAAKAAAAAAAKKKAAADAAKKDAFAGVKKKPVALDGRPTAPSAADITKARGTPPPVVSDKLPKNPEDLPKMFPELKGADKETVKKAYDAMNKVATGTAAEKLQGLSDLSKNFPESMGNVLEKLGVKDNKLVKIATNKDALAALSTLTDGTKGVADKTQAALQLAKAVGDTVAPKDLEGVLKTTLSALGPADKLVGAIATWSDPSKTGLEKAKSTLELAEAIKEFAGADSAKLANKLRVLDGPLKAAGAALTLLDPKASASDKIIAGAQLASEIPELGKNLTAFKDLLTSKGVKDAEKIADGAVKAAEVAVKGLDPKLASTLTEAQTKQLSELATKVGPDELEGVLKGITDKAALESLTKKLTTLDAPAGKRLLSTLGGMEHGVLEKALKNPEMAESLAKLATKLDDEGAKVMSKMVKDFDEPALKSLVKFTDQLAPDALKDGLKVLGPVMEKGGSKIVGQGLQVLEKVLGKMGAKITGEVAAKALKNLIKIIPVAGAIPNAIDAVKYGMEAVELRDKNRDLGMLAMNAAKLNAADGVVGIVLDATGVGVGVDIAVSVAFSAAELAIDIGFEAEKAKMEADPKNYKAPDWVKAVNLAGAAVDPVGTIAYMGPEGAAQLLEWGVEKGAKGSVELAKFIGVSTAEAAGDQLKTAGKMMHALADVIRNPSKYGQAVADAAIKTYNTVIEKGGELARAAKETLTSIVNDAKALGAKGLEKLEWIAKNPGEAAKIAVEGVKDMVSKGLELGTEAGKAIYKKGVETLENLQKGWENLKGAAKEKALELITSAKDGLKAAVNKAVELGGKAIDLVAWAATHPGEVGAMAKKGIQDALAKGGEIAKQAWDGIKALGNKGLDLAQSAISTLKNAGEAAVDTLKYVIQNPGEAAAKVRDWAGQTLKNIVVAGGEAAKKAAGAIKDFIDARLDFAMKLGKDLVQSGAKAFMEVAKAWKDNLTEGGKAFLDGLKDLGSAGVDALKDLAKIGGQVAGYAVDKLESLAKAGVGYARDALGALADFGGEVGRLAGKTVDAVADFTDGEFSVGGYKVDLNPFW
ncbi:MAG: Dauer Up-regulated [Archangium sp.]|nr:Dauer Up-regulated [Archangium sp.]